MAALCLWHGMPQTCIRAVNVLRRALGRLGVGRPVMPLPLASVTIGGAIHHSGCQVFLHQQLQPTKVICHDSKLHQVMGMTIL